MRIINICCNYGSYKDGIGAYSKNIVDSIKKCNQNIEIVNLYTDIYNYNKIQKICSFEMSKIIKKAIKMIKTDNYDIINIEYPFTEWNPVIVFYYNKLYKECQRKKVKLVLSLHEYERVNFFRRKVIEQMVKSSNNVLITSVDEKNKLKYLNNNIYIRNIPSNIKAIKKIGLNQKKLNEYVFFGLINKSKSFSEMIEGWKLFVNEKKDCKLTIITSSEIDIEDCEKYNICVKRNLDDEQIEDIMTIASFCILPINPSIGLNNATLKTASLFGCIPIGILCEKFKSENIGINMNTYTDEEFSEVLKKTIDLDKKEITNKQNNVLEFGKEFCIDDISKTIIEIWKK